jgi:hypothetical protein
MKIWPGSVLRLRIRIKSITFVAADPTTLTFKMREPDGTLTTYVYGTHAELVKAGVGDYYVDWTVDQSGQHYWRAEATGTNPGAQESFFDVLESAI